MKIQGQSAMRFWTWLWNSSPFSGFLSWFWNRFFPPAAPDIIDTSFALSEGSEIGSVVGTPDISGSTSGQLTWSIIDGNIEGAFSINAQTGEISVADTSVLDYEANQTWSLIVQVQRGRSTDTATITVNLTDVNEAPSAGNPIQTSAPENVADTTVIASVNASDPDTRADTDTDTANDSFNDLTYSITGGDPDGLFEIDAGGNVSLAAGKVLDYETAQQHVLIVTVTDGGSLTDTTTVTIDVTDVNEKPDAGSDIITSVREDVDDTTVIADVDSADPDTLVDSDTDPSNDTFNDLTYSIASGNDDGLFEIDSATGEISLVAGKSLDYQLAQQHVLQVTVTDGGQLSDTVLVTVNLTRPTPVMIGDEFRVNQSTAGDQNQPSITALPDGQFLISWGSADDELGAYEILGQQFAADGSYVGLPFSSSDNLVSYKGGPALTMLHNGGYAIVWTSYEQDGDQAGVYGKLFDDAGNAIGAEFQVNTYFYENQSGANITALNNGGFAVFWNSSDQDSGTYGVYGQVYDQNGERVGAEFKVNQFSSGSQYAQQARAAATLDDGRFVVTWNSVGQDGSDQGVFARIFHADGTPETDEFQVNTYTLGSQNNAAISSLEDGGFIVVWSSYEQETQEHGSGRGIFAQQYDGSGIPVGEEFQVNSTIAFDQMNPFVTSLPDGGFVIAWVSYTQFETDSELYGMRFDADGNQVGSEFLINTQTDDFQISVTIESLSSSEFVVAWTSFGGQDGDGQGIYAQRFEIDDAILYASDDPDTFWFGLGTEDVAIQGFELGQDQIDLTAFGTSLSDTFSLASNGDGGTLVTLSETESINILGVSPTDLLQTDDVFLLA